MTKDSIMSTVEEGLREHTGEPMTPEGEVVYLTLMRRYGKTMALEMKPPW
jgi:hypothetical protein